MSFPTNISAIEGITEEVIYLKYIRDLLINKLAFENKKNEMLHNQITDLEKKLHAQHSEEDGKFQDLIKELYLMDKNIRCQNSNPSTSYFVQHSQEKSKFRTSSVRPSNSTLFKNPNAKLAENCVGNGTKIENELSSGPSIFPPQSCQQQNIDIKVQMAPNDIKKPKKLMKTFKISLPGKKFSSKFLTKDHFNFRKKMTLMHKFLKDSKEKFYFKEFLAGIKKNVPSSGKSDTITLINGEIPNISKSTDSLNSKKAKFEGMKPEKNLFKDGLLRVNKDPLHSKNERISTSFKSSNSSNSEKVDSDMKLKKNTFTEVSLLNSNHSKSDSASSLHGIIDKVNFNYEVSEKLSDFMLKTQQSESNSALCVHEIMNRVKLNCQVSENLSDLLLKSNRDIGSKVDELLSEKEVLMQEFLKTLKEKKMIQTSS